MKFRFPLRFSLCTTILSPMLSKCTGPHSLHRGWCRPVRACVIVSTLEYNISWIQALSGELPNDPFFAIFSVKGHARLQARGHPRVSLLGCHSGAHHRPQVVAGGRLGSLLVHPYRGWPYSRAGEAGFFSRLDVAAKRAAETSIFSPPDSNERLLLGAMSFRFVLLRKTADRLLLAPPSLSHCFATQLYR